MSRKLIALLLVLLLAMSLGVQALAEVHKDEVVYAKLDAAGKVTQTVLVNAFESTQPSSVTDYGAYSDVQPLGAAEGFAYNDGMATFTMHEGRFSYQGIPDKQELPWTIAISYTLDGQAVEPAALSGTSGELEGRLQIKVNEDLLAFAKNQTLQITITLDGDKTFDIKADKATLAIAGGKRSIAFVILPGQEADYTFTARVQEFSMEGIQFAGIRMGMDAQMYQNAAAAAIAGSPLEGAITGIMGGMLNSMQGQQPVSYTDARNPVRSLQFVIFSEGIPEAAKEAAPAQNEEELSFWQRLLSLVGL